MAENEDAKPIATQRVTPLAKAGFSFLPQSWEQLYAYAKEIATTEFVPDAMRGKPGAVLAAWQKGQEVGLPPMAALQSIAIINGRPSIHSAGYWALITGHPLCEYTQELGPDDALTAGYGECTVKRRGAPNAVARRFTVAMAEKAGLWGGTGDTKEKKERSVWFKYPGRMLQMRARHMAGDDAIPEAAQGLLPADIARDLEPTDVTPTTPEPLKIPQPLKGKAYDQGKTRKGNQVDQAGNQGLRGPDQVGESAADGVPAESSETGTAARGDNAPGAKSVEQQALDEIEGYTADTLPPASHLNVYMKGQHPKVQANICAAYNRKKAELGL